MSIKTGESKMPASPVRKPHTRITYILTPGANFRKTSSVLVEYDVFFIQYTRVQTNAIIAVTQMIIPMISLVLPREITSNISNIASTTSPIHRKIVISDNTNEIISHGEV